jgi:hypothetical protein
MMGSGGVDNSQFLFVVFGLSFVAASAIVAFALSRVRKE